MLTATRMSSADRCLPAGPFPEPCVIGAGLPLDKCAKSHLGEILAAVWSGGVLCGQAALQNGVPRGAPIRSARDQRAVLNARIDAKVAEAVRTGRFGEVLAARGVTTVALDDPGRLTLYQPDGTTSGCTRRSTLDRN